MGEALGNPNYNLYCPAALIIPSNVEGGAWDNACAMENIMLAAHSMGVASVWINQLSDTCDDPRVRAMLTELGVPEEHKVFGMAALGYAAAEPRPADGSSRYSNEQRQNNGSAPAHSKTAGHRTR